MAVYDPDLPTMEQITDLQHEINLQIVELGEADSAVRKMAAGLALTTLTAKMAKHAINLRAGYEYAEQQGQSRII